jgi:replicative superfamily II helicase
MKYGVKSELVSFCKLPEIGKVRAEKLWNSGFRTYSDIIDNQVKMQAVLNVNQTKIDNIVHVAKKAVYGI